MSRLNRLKGWNKGGVIRRLLLAALLGLAVLALFLPALWCLAAGGWLVWLGLAALLVWLGLGWWIWQAWRQWRKNNFEDYA